RSSRDFGPSVGGRNIKRGTNPKRLGRRAVLIGLAGTPALLLAWRYAFANDDHAASGIAGRVTLIDFTDSGERKGTIMADKIVKSDAEWRKVLAPEQYQVARRAGTERAYTGKYWNNHDKGI